MPDLLDPWRAAARREQYAGALALAIFPRLQPLLVSTDADAAVTYQIQFGIDRDGRAVVTGTLETTLQVVCQRCLGTLALPVNATLNLALLRDLDALEQLPECYEPLLVEERLIPPHQFIEDELLLAVPAIPRHAAAEHCERWLAAQVTATEVAPPSDQNARVNPFAAALANWKAPPERL
ncbi:DUF177 domain-containing protein [Rhodoferax sp. 4810]|nr:DUF177 domain-containing protein [Rhodoferax jenense]